MLTPLLCSVVCPTRGRLARLRRMIGSVVGTAADVGRIEIILRMHGDDGETLRAIPEILGLGPVRVVIGEPMGGYGDLTRFYEEGLALSRGKWVWVMNDDVVCETPGWDNELARIGHECVVMPEVHKLGGSTYARDLQTPFMWVPNGCWERYLKGEPMRDPFDAGLWTLLRENGWETEFIPVTVNHERAAPEDEERARREREHWERLNPEEECRY